MSLPTTIAVLALAVVLTAAATPPNGDPGRFMAQAWTTEDGLPQSSVNDLVQTSDGYLWIATFGGLARFDGVEFESFGTARHTDLPSNRILSLVDAEDGTLWVGTEMSGIVFLKDGVFHTFEPPDGLGLQGVAEIHIGPSGTIWIGTAYDLLRLRPNGDFKRFTIDDGLAQPPVYTVLEETDGTVWLGGQGGVSVLRENHIESVTHAGNPVSWVQAILRSRSGELLVGAAEGLFRLLPGRELEPKPLPDNPNLQEVSALLEDRDGGLWIGTLRHGLFLSVKGSLRNIGLEAGHTFNDTTALFEDAEGTLWVGTSADGLFQLNPCKFSSVGGAPLNVSTTSITDDGRGGLWIGTNCHGLAHLESGEITILGEPQGLATNCIWSVLRSQNGDLYIGTFNDGLYRLRDSILEILDGPATSGSEISIRALDEAADGSLLVGTNDGAFRFDPATSTFTPIDGTADLLVYFITQDQEDRLWLGTHTGLHIVSGQRHDIWDTGNGLTSNLVRAVHLDQDGTAWIGTYGGGLYRLDGDHLSHFGKHNGLRENVVSMIVEDEFDRLWLTGNSGVTRVSKSELQRIADGLSDEVHSTLFGKSDGMLENECNGGSQPAGFLAADGHFWVPTIKGIAVVDTRADSVNPLPPPVHIKEVRIDGRPLDLSRPIDLPPGSRNLEISYTALSFVAPSKVRFKTRLTGIDEAWQDTGNRRVAYFPYVPPGRHQFQVIASNNDGVWNDTGVSFDFTVEPYFVQTPWFFGLVLLAVAAVVVAFMLTRQRALKRKELLLSRLVTDRTSELQRLAKLTERINSGFLLEEVLQHIFDACRPAIPYHRIGFAALTRDGKSVRARWVCSDSETMEIDRGYEAPLEGSSLARILETGNPRILDDLEAYLRDHPDSESTRRIVAEGMRSSLTCPLVAMGKPMGFLFFSSRRRAAFTDDHVKFFLQIGAHLSLAIEKSRLYSDLLNTRERLEEANRALEIQASRDGLTGLANRRTLDRQINLEWNRAIRSRTHLSLMMIDIDHFKLFNDTYGHLQGDDCLKKVADEIQRAFHRAGECAARYGGEEFAVVLPEATAAEACQAAAYLLKSIDNLGLQHETSPVGPNVTISIGIATALPKSTAPIQNLIAEADNALYRAKRDGRHGWVHATADGDV